MTFQKKDYIKNVWFGEVPTDERKGNKMIEKKILDKIYKKPLSILHRLHTLDVVRMLDNLHARILKIGPKGNLQYCVDGYSKMAAVMIENALGDIGEEKVLKVIESYLRRAGYYPEFMQLSKDEQVLFAALEIVRHDAVIVNCAKELCI